MLAKQFSLVMQLTSSIIYIFLHGSYSRIQLCYLDVIIINSMCYRNLKFVKNKLYEKITKFMMWSFHQSVWHRYMFVMPIWLPPVCSRTFLRALSYAQYDEIVSKQYFWVYFHWSEAFPRSVSCLAFVFVLYFTHIRINVWWQNKCIYFVYVFLCMHAYTHLVSMDSCSKQIYKSQENWPVGTHCWLIFEVLWMMWFKQEK